MDGYFGAELNAYRWVQLECNVAKKLVSEHDDFNLDTSHVYIEMVDDENKTYYEYHVDTHPILLNYVKLYQWVVI